MQIVRTQPEENDKTIKATYFHAVQFARRYLYVENQYFFYESWARHLKRQRATFMKALQANGQCVDESPLLHLFVVTPWPEDDGMVPRTYDTMKSLGEADSFPNQKRRDGEDGQAGRGVGRVPGAGAGGGSSDAGQDA